jgi:hypothetical protein
MAVADAGDNSDAVTSYLKLRKACLAYGMTLFHTTPSKNIESITQKGLVPIQGSEPKPIFGSPNAYPVDGVFLGNFTAAHRLSREWATSDNPFTLLEVRVPKNTTVYEDPLMPKESVIVPKVSRSNLRVLTPAEVAIYQQMKASSTDLSRLFGGSHE